MDCGQNALDKQAQPAFNGLASETKVLVVLKGANHCQWIQPFEKGCMLVQIFLVDVMDCCYGSLSCVCTKICVCWKAAT